MIKLIDLTDWKKQKDIILELHREWGINITSREWRIQVEKWNEKFINDEVPYYITHSNSKGYKATTDYEEAQEAIRDYKKRALNMLKKARACNLAFQRKRNYKIDFEKGELK